jgi:hypothetical protein
LESFFHRQPSSVAILPRTASWICSISRRQKGLQTKARVEIAISVRSAGYFQIGALSSQQVVVSILAQ